MLETSGKQRIDIDRFLPHTPLRIVVDHTGEEVTDSYSVTMLNKSVVLGRMDSLLNNGAFVETVLPDMISSATEIAEEMGEREIEKGLERMKRTLIMKSIGLPHCKKRTKTSCPMKFRQLLKNEIPYPPLSKKQEYDWML
ncbi:RNA polymerase recycling family protein [Algoriphagus antarcticus]|uniref:RNA polymerase recycling family protein n=1 Tax=Algoriphagus antarcticus TaxID=238540 RepID=A0A3E0DAK2_9BACT|nr:hypothetical protein [Algoriphagus antarcticus]REG79604.1 RNA polymerase recycling family protein [Algoriphagus antarcticus]